MDKKTIQWAVNDKKWQVFRTTLLQLPTKEKLKRLEDYRRKHRTYKAQVQVENYINALKRGGLIK